VRRVACNSKVVPLGAMGAALAGRRYDSIPRRKAPVRPGSRGPCMDYHLHRSCTQSAAYRSCMGTFKGRESTFCIMAGPSERATMAAAMAQEATGGCNRGDF
jgi:hypothetical protein